MKAVKRVYSQWEQLERLRGCFERLAQYKYFGTLAMDNTPPVTVTQNLYRECLIEGECDPSLIFCTTDDNLVEICKVMIPIEKIIKIVFTRAGKKGTVDLINIICEEETVRVYGIKEVG